MKSGIQTADHHIAKRRWWVALLLQLLGGIGYLYVGQPIRFFLFLLFSVCIYFSLHLIPSAWLVEPAALLAFWAVCIAVLLAFVADVIRLAVKKKHYVLQSYNRWWFYLGAFLLAAGATFVDDALGGRETSSIRQFAIMSSSSLPNLQAGDWIMTNNKAYKSSPPQRGDLAVFKKPNNPTQNWIFRIIGLPGDRVQLRNSIVWINDRSVERIKKGKSFFENTGQTIPIFVETLPNGKSYQTIDVQPNSYTDNTPVFSVPEGHYFLLGDNRDNSADSRFDVGMIPRANIFGKVKLIYWSTDLSRIGKVVE